MLNLKSNLSFKQLARIKLFCVKTSKHLFIASILKKSKEIGLNLLLNECLQNRRNGG
jgi:hypothetical protein